MPPDPATYAKRKTQGRNKLTTGADGSTGPAPQLIISPPWYVKIFRMYVHYKDQSVHQNSHFKFSRT